MLVTCRSNRFTFSPFRAFALLLCLLLCAQVAQADADRSLDAVCRVSAAGGQGGVGSGCVFHIAEGKVLVITAAHVVEGARQATCEFWYRGHQSAPLQAVVVGADPAADIAVVGLQAREFGGILPKVIPLALPQTVVRPGETLTSAGCSNGAWATAFEGHALGYSGTDLYFVPPPANGRSGSALCNAEGRIVGIVTARTEDRANGMAGIAASIQAAYASWGSAAERRRALTALRIKPAGRLVPVGHQAGGGRLEAGGTVTSGLAPRPSGLRPSVSSLCRPEGCQGGIADPYGVQPRWYLLPYRYREQFRNQPPQPLPAPAQPAQPWPTLPLPEGENHGETLSGADLGPVNQRLDRIAGLLEQLLAGMAAQTQWEAEQRAADSTEPPQVAPQVQDAVEEVQGQVEAIRQDVQAETSRLRQAAQALIDNREELLAAAGAVRDRLEQTRAQHPEVGLAGAARIAARDFAAEQLKTGTPGLTLGHLLAAALGLSC